MYTIPDYWLTESCQKNYEKNSWIEFLSAIATQYCIAHNANTNANYEKVMDDLEHGVTPDMQRYELPVS